MPGTSRIAPGGIIFHRLGRGNNREDVFADEGDFAAERVMEKTAEAVPMRIRCLRTTRCA